MRKGLFIFILIFLGSITGAQDMPGAAELPQIVSPDPGDVNDEMTPEEPAAEEVPLDVMPAYLLSEAGGSIRFIQRLSWQKAQYAVRYSVLLERKNEEMDTFVEALRRNLDAEINYIDVSVPAGEYRYRVYSFNVLGLLDTSTEWEYFTVLRAIQPAISSFYPEAFYLDRETPRILNLTGENLLPDTEIYLVSLTLLDENNEPLIIKPIELHLNELGETARLFFDDEDIVAGSYEIMAINPGGLYDKTGTFSVSIAKPFDINVAGGYSPSLSLIGHKNYFMDQIFVPLSFSARASYVPFKLNIGFFGIEADLNWTLFTSTPASGDIKSTSAHLVTINANALYQYWIIRNKLSLNGRAGIGLAGLFDFHIEYYSSGKSSSSYNTVAFSINAGGSVQWFFHKQVYAEAGLDYNQILHSEFGIGFVRIGLFCGYQF